MKILYIHIIFGIISNMKINKSKKYENERKRQREIRRNILFLKKCIYLLPIAIKQIEKNIHQNEQYIEIYRKKNI